MKSNRPVDIVTLPCGYHDALYEELTNAAAQSILEKVQLRAIDVGAYSPGNDFYRHCLEIAEHPIEIDSVPTVVKPELLEFLKTMGPNESDSVLGMNSPFLADMQRDLGNTVNDIYPPKFKTTPSFIDGDTAFPNRRKTKPNKSNRLKKIKAAKAARKQSRK